MDCNSPAVEEAAQKVLESMGNNRAQEHFLQGVRNDSIRMEKCLIIELSKKEKGAHAILLPSGVSAEVFARAIIAFLKQHSR